MIIRKNIICVWFFLVILIFVPACSSLMMPPIIKATDSRQLGQINRLVSAGVDVDTATKKGMTPLFAASAKGYDRIAASLIEKGADVNAAVTNPIKYNDLKLAQWTTPLMAALWGQHSKIGHILIENGADISRTDDNGVGALFIAAMQDDRQMINVLIEKGADVNAGTTTDFELDGGMVFAGTTPLMAALACRQNENAYILIENGASVNARDDNGRSVLMIAAENSGVDMVKFLLAKGADPALTITKDFISNGLPTFEGANALMAAAGAGKFNSVYELLRAGSNVNATTRNGVTALMAAAASGHLAVTKLLVGIGAEVNARTTEPYNIGIKPIEAVHKGTTPLLAASSHGHVRVVEFLIANGADVNAEDDFGMDALYLASANGYLNVVKILIANNADVYNTLSGSTALVAAAHGGNPYIVDLIKAARKKRERQKSQEKKPADEKLTRLWK